MKEMAAEKNTSDTTPLDFEAKLLVETDLKALESLQDFLVGQATSIKSNMVTRSGTSEAYALEVANMLGKVEKRIAELSTKNTPKKLTRLVSVKSGTQKVTPAKKSSTDTPFNPDIRQEIPVFAAETPPDPAKVAEIRPAKTRTPTIKETQVATSARQIQLLKKEAIVEVPSAPAEIKKAPESTSTEAVTPESELKALENLQEYFSGKIAEIKTNVAARAQVSPETLANFENELKKVEGEIVALKEKITPKPKTEPSPTKETGEKGWFARALDKISQKTEKLVSDTKGIVGIAWKNFEKKSNVALSGAGLALLLTLMVVPQKENSKKEVAEPVKNEEVVPEIPKPMPQQNTEIEIKGTPIHTVILGETLYDLLKKDFKDVRELSGAQQTNMIENILSGLNAKDIGITSGNLSEMKVGDIIDYQKIQTVIDSKRINGKTLKEHAQTLPKETVKNIENYRPLEGSNEELEQATFKAEMELEDFVKSIYGKKGLIIGGISLGFSSSDGLKEWAMVENIEIQNLKNGSILPSIERKTEETIADLKANTGLEPKEHEMVRKFFIRALAKAKLNTLQTKTVIKT